MQFIWLGKLTQLSKGSKLEKFQDLQRPTLSYISGKKMGHGDSAASKDAWGCAEVMGSNIFNSQAQK